MKLKFRGLNVRVVETVHAAKAIDFLFQEDVLGQQETRTLLQKTDRRQQCRDLLALLHESGHPKAFLKLYDAIKKEPAYQWLIDEIDNCPTGRPKY